MTKEKLRYFYTFTLLLIAVWLIFPQGISLGQEISSQTINYVFPNPLNTTTTITGLIYKILAFLLKIAVPITAIMIVWAGFLFVTSAGNEAKVKSAQKTLIWAIVGLAVVLLAQSVPGIIKEFLGGNTQEATQTQTQTNSDYNYGYGPGGEIPHTFTPPAPPQEQPLGGMKYKGTICVYDPNANGDDPECGQPFL